MERPKQFSENQYVGDKRTQVVYDVDAISGADEALITELMTAETYSSVPYAHLTLPTNTPLDNHGRSVRPETSQADF